MPKGQLAYLAPPPSGLPGRRAAPSYACILNAVLRHPPIRHRGAPHSAGLSVAEFTVGVAAATMARASLAEQRHEAALRSGRKEISALRGERLYAPGFTPDEIFRGRVSSAYDEGRRAFNRNSNGPIEMRCSASKLLRVSGLAPNGKNIAQLPAVFARLTRPVRVGRKDLPGPLVSWRKTDRNSFQLVVAGAWIPLRKFDRIPWPPPTQGPTVLELFLFCFGIDQRRESKASIKLERLAQRLGIPWTWPSDATRSLDRALGLLNAHLARLSKSKTGPSFPDAFCFKWLDGARVQIRPQFRHSEPATGYDEVDDAATAADKTTAGPSWESFAAEADWKRLGQEIKREEFWEKYEAANDESDG